MYFSPLALATLSYPAFALAGVFLQPLAGLTAGSLAAMGTLRFDVAFGIFFAVDIAMDCVWYALGTRHSNRINTWVMRISGATNADGARIGRLFATYPERIIVISKILGGSPLMPFILFTAAANGMRFSRYIVANMLGELGLLTLLMGIGYFFGSSIQAVNSVFEKEALAIGGIILLALAAYGVRRLHARLFAHTP